MLQRSTEMEKGSQRTKRVNYKTAYAKMIAALKKKYICILMNRKNMEKYAFMVV